MTRYAIGIDTGGTYTDAALIDASARTMLAKAKALTTKGDLSIGVTEALDKVLDASAGHGVTGADIALVSLSTTLATNAIVEGHGSAIGVILVGFDDKMAERTEIARAIPGARILRVAGGHDHAGNEAARLDDAAISAFLSETGGAVEAYATAAHYSVRNPAHEQRVRALAAELTGRPTTLSSDLAHALDAPRRALTAALNARIIARIVALVAAVRLSMRRHGVEAPLMIVKGDGTLADADAVAQRPIETILSGPAASVIGAKFLSGLADFVISDIGGTTTDVAVLENGWPKLDRSGAMVGGRRTMVRAIDMRTFGLGGDSEVDFENDGRVVLRANRIVPVSLLASRHPSALRHMRKVLADPEGEPYAGRFLVRPFGHAGADGAAAADLTIREREMLDRVQGEPVPMQEAIRGPSSHRALDRLVGLGLLQVSGFTPSDAAHVLGLQGQWLREGAVLAGALFKRWRRMSATLDTANADTFARDFAAEVIHAVVTKTGRVILETLAGGPLDGAASPLVDAVVSGAGRLRGLAVAISPVSPVVAVGGPASVYYPQVGQRLGCAIVLPEHGDVANAVGAAVGVVKVQAVVEISSQGMGAWRIHADGEPIPVADPGEALARALAMAEDAARAGALAMGATHPVVEMHIDRVDLPDMQGDRGLIAATIIAESWGAPKAVEENEAVDAAAPGLA